MTLWKDTVAFLSSCSPVERPLEGKPGYLELDIGVWRVIIAKESLFRLPGTRFFQDVMGVSPLFHRACKDLYSISPPMFLFTICANLWYAMERTLSLYFSSRLLFHIERRLSEGSASQSGLWWAVIARILCTLLTSIVRWVSDKTTESYKTRIRYIMEGKVFAASLSEDVLGRSDSVVRCDANVLFTCLEIVLTLSQDIVSSFSQLRLLLHILDTDLVYAGPVFTALCVCSSFAEDMSKAGLWGRKYVALAVNKSYLRKKTLLRLVNLDLKQEIAGAGISKYLMDEFHSAQTNLHDIPDTRPESLYASHRPLPSRIISQLCPQAVMLYAATVALFSPSKISLAQLAVIEQTNVTLRQTLSSFSFFASRLPQEVAKLGSFYRTLDAKAEMIDGDTPYPRKGYDTSSGMSIEFRNVSFDYPSTESGRSALSNVSFTIQPGQLVVIVGCNGSGKTTIIKLLSRFYDVDGGTILIDGIPIQEYRMAELRKGISMLSQEHALFPLSVEENVAIGSPDPAAMQDTGKLKESMKLAGAEKIVDNFTDGMKTVLRPISEEYMSFSAYGNSTLEDIYNSCSKWKDISGGEKQRLVAARTFMRLLSTPVKLVAVDEPSSALDPAGEFELFSNLRQARDGRTMIFVTHRFGHLTKHADLILCVKDGVLVETGTHSELLAVNGEYAHLYNVQAQAFSPKPV